MNERGIARRGRKWSTTTIQELLDNRAYIGEYFFNKKKAKTQKRKPESEWIRVDLEPIIEKKIFEQVKLCRKMRSPAVVPPRVVNTPTLLTGLLKCGSCGSGMTIATGKGGKYRYYKCTRRIKSGIKECESRNIPMKRMDDLVLEAFANRVFTPERVGGILKRVQARMKNFRSRHEDQLGELKRQLNQINQKTERLYEAVESGVLPMDVTLQERAQRHKARREEILTQIAGLRRAKEMPLNQLGVMNIDTFCSAMKQKLKDKSSNFGKDYLRLLVEEIEINGNEAVIRGNDIALAGAVSKTKMGTLPRVPIFLPDWLPGTDSNPACRVVNPACGGTLPTELP